MLCQNCPPKKKSVCKTLCPKAEKYVRQDHVSQRESPLSEVREYANATMNMHTDNVFYYISSHSFQELNDYYSAEQQIFQFPFLSTIQNKALYLFYFDGLSYAEIARNLKQDKTTLNNQIYSAKQKISKFFTKNEENE